MIVYHLETEDERYLRLNHALSLDDVATITAMNGYRERYDATDGTITLIIPKR